MQVAVIGIGESMRGDDAAGPQAVRLWQRKNPETLSRPDVQVQIVEQGVLELLEALQGADAAVLVDAIQSGSEPGAVRQFAAEDLDSAALSNGSMHAWGVAEALALGRALEQLPKNLTIRIVGIEAQQAEFGAALSDCVERSLPAACASIQAQVRAFLKA